MLAMSPNPVCTTVHVEGVRARKSNQGDTGALRSGNCQRAGGRNSDDDRNAGGQGLLHDFEADTATHHEPSVVGRDLAVEEQAPDHLVDGIVAADVLTNDAELTVVPCQPRRMASPRFRKVQLTQP